MGGCWITDYLYRLSVFTAVFLEYQPKIVSKIILNFTYRKTKNDSDSVFAEIIALDEWTKKAASNHIKWLDKNYLKNEKNI